MRLRLAMLAVLSLCIGCDDDTTGSHGNDLDLAVVNDDLAVPADLAPPAQDLLQCALTSDASTGPHPVDAGALCAGTMLEGTCAEAFFTRIVDCFDPDGCCVREVHGLPDAEYTIDWSSGASMQHVFVNETGQGNTMLPFIHWWRGCSDCGRVEIGGGGTNIDRWILSDGTTLFYANKTGDVQCPDGTSVNIGTNYSACSDLFAGLDVFGTSNSPYSCVVGGAAAPICH